MRQDPDHERGPSPGPGTRNRIITWVKICVFILVVLIGLKLLGVQIFVRIDFDDKPMLAALTEIETYYLPLGLLLLYLLGAWIWERLLGPKDE